jgi:hypothetical protein
MTLTAAWGDVRAGLQWAAMGFIHLALIAPSVGAFDRRLAGAHHGAVVEHGHGRFAGAEQQASGRYLPRMTWWRSQRRQWAALASDDLQALGDRAVVADGKR